MKIDTGTLENGESLNEIQRELQKSPLEITKAGGKSTLLTGKIKEEFV